MYNKNYLFAEVIVVVSIIAIISIGLGNNRITGMYAGSYATVGVLTDRPVYTEGGTVSIYVSVKSQVPASDTVALSVILPDGSFSTRYLRTDDNGGIKFDYFLDSGSQKGTYVVGATAYRGGDTFKGRTIFEVK
jgi:uncharacterized protein YfaS (alpha-2-macroglobulin family)